MVLAGRGPGTPEQSSDAEYASEALVVDAAYRYGSWAAVRALLKVGPDTDALLAALRTMVPDVGTDVNAWWRRAAVEYAAGPMRIR